jgi:hypothetical protein
LLTQPFGFGGNLSNAVSRNHRHGTIKPTLVLDPDIPYGIALTGCHFSNPADSFPFDAGIRIALVNRATRRNFSEESGIGAKPDGVMNRLACLTQWARGRHGLARSRSAIALGLSLLGSAPSVCAIDSVRGLPFSRIYSLEDVGYVPRGSRLNFDAFGRVAVIHEGVYAVLNDTAWSNLIDPDDAARLPMTEVVHAGYGRYYYGGRASWGFAEFGADGKVHGKSLVPPNPPTWTRTTSFDDVIVTTEGVYFASRGGVAFWDFAEKKCQLFEVPKMARAFAVGKTVFISRFDQPLSVIDVNARKIRSMPGTALDQRVVVRATTLDETRTLVSSLDGPPQVFDGANVTPWRIEPPIDLTGRISALERLVDGNIAIALTGKGVFVLSPEGKLLLSLTIPQYHRVSSIASRERGVLWLLTEDSVEKILYQGGLTSFGQRLGLPLAWPVVASWNNRLRVRRRDSSR